MKAALIPWRRSLESPFVYAALMHILGADKGMARLVGEHLKIRPGEKVLDVGCGPGRLIPYLPAVDYVGLDNDRKYLERARSRHPGQLFEMVDVSAQGGWCERSDFDVVVASGLLHHLPDAAVRRTIAYCHDRMRSGGRLVTLDCAIEDGQPLLAQWLARADRGRFVRPARGYLDLVRTVFPTATLTIRNDLLSVPYTHAIIACGKP